MITDTVLFVDDERNVLEGIRRQLRRGYRVETAVGGEAALELFEAGARFAVVVSDMRMPGMNGVQFLTKVRERDPDAVRMVLTGQSELSTTIEAVNYGNVFRFLTKPCSSEALTGAVDAALRQYRLVMAERELLEKTLSGAVQLITDIMAMVNPMAFSRAGRIQRVMDELLEHLDAPNSWEMRLAGMLSLIGCLSVPEDVLAKAFAGQALEPDEQSAFDAHPEHARQLLGHIPRLERVAEIVGTRASGEGSAELPATTAEWTTEVLGVQVLTAASRFDELVSLGHQPSAAWDAIRSSAVLHPRTLEALARVRVERADQVSQVSVSELRRGMVIEEDVRTVDGDLLLASGYEVTDAIILRLRSLAHRRAVAEPIRVRAKVASVDVSSVRDPSEHSEPVPVPS